MSLAIVIGKKAAGVKGKTVTTAYSNRDLSDIVINEGGIIVGAISSDAFTIVAGTYRIDSKCCFCGNTGSNVIQYIHRLWNQDESDYLFKLSGAVTAATELYRASTPVRADDTQKNHWSFHTGVVTINSSLTISIQSRSSINNADVIEGKPASLGENEVYTIIKILKVA